MPLYGSDVVIAFPWTSDLSCWEIYNKMNYMQVVELLIELFQAAT